MVTVGVTGVGGRMGAILARLIHQDASLHLRHGVVSPSSPLAGSDVGELANGSGMGVAAIDSVNAAAKDVDVIVDFSVPECTSGCASACREHGTGLVTGTTGLTEKQREALEDLARHVPVVAAANMSLGICVLQRLVESAARSLLRADVEIFELHHRNKVDSPSGTALALGDRVLRARSEGPEAGFVHGRSGAIGPRNAGEIGFHAARAGDVVGEHTVTLALDGERIELTHRAQDRRAFAAGALQAVKFVAEQSRAGRSGMFTMEDVLDL
ncbi:MAG: 4-hydroxy-tetrahydrodipicolinate reductase [Pseudomonadales bacterium]|nr:4-hydroxy-tetrahydrodipicolinate reductase [Pseudomonadales bacterium]